MIERLVIHRFRGIRQGDLSDLGKINLLIGPNNSGKTAILEMLYLGGTSGRPTQFIRQDLPPEEGVFEASTSLPADLLGLSPLSRLRERHGKSPLWLNNPAVLTEAGSLQVNLAAIHNSNSSWKSFQLSAPLEEWGVKKSAQFTQADIERLALFTLARAGKVHAGMIPPYFEEVKIRAEDTRWHYLWEPEWVHLAQRKSPIDHLAVWAEAGYPLQADRVLFFDFHTANAHFTREFAQWAKNQPWDWTKRIGNHLARIFRDLKGAKIEIDDAPDMQEGESGYIRRQGEGRLSIDQFGDGARHAFKLLAGLTALAESVDEAHPGLFLWEDPELFLHPEALYRLLKEVMQIVQNQPIQVFVTSQSLEYVGLLTALFQQKQAKQQKMLRTFRLKLDAGQLQAAKFRYENLYTWLEQGMDPRFWNVVDLPISYRYRGTEKTFSEEDV